MHYSSLRDLDNIVKKKYISNDDSNLYNTHSDYNNLSDKSLVSYNFARINKELENAKNENNFLDIDENTGIPMYKMNIDLKNFDFECANLKNNAINNSKLHDFAPNGQLLLMKFKYKNNKNLMTIDEIKKYIDIKGENIIFLQKVSPKIIYKIAKSLNNEFYFIVNSQDNVIPMSPEQAELILKRGQNFNLNYNIHINDIFNSYGEKYEPNSLQSAFYKWFCKNVNHMHPYAYSDMVITEEVKNYSFKKKENGREMIVKTQFSNELTDKEISLQNISRLKKFALKCNDAYMSAVSRGEEYVFAMPFPLYSKNHMLSLVLVFKPNGKITGTIVNANGYRDAKYRYAIPIGNILQMVFEKYAPSVGKKINYFFHENNSQYDGTCMTHADCITKQLVRDKTLEFDGKNLHPAKIWEKAYIRGFATTIYQHAKKQNAFVSNTNKIKQLEQKKNVKDKFAYNVNNNISTSKFLRDFNEKNQNK